MTLSFQFPVLSHMYALFIGEITYGEEHVKLAIVPG